MRLQTRTLLLIILLILSAALLGAQNVVFSITPAALRPGEKGVIKAMLSIPEEMKQSREDDDYFYLSAEHSSLSFGKTQYPPPTKTSEDGIPEYHKSVTLSLPFTVKTTARPGRITIDTEMAYGLCTYAGFCYPPEFPVGKVNLEILPAETVAAGETTESGEEVVTALEDSVSDVVDQATSELPEPPQGAKSDTSALNILFYMLLAVLGGFVLNFTPCVLPILPIRAMSMINQAQKDVTKVFIHTLVYALGVLISFGSIAMVFVIARLSGINLTYGFLSQSLTYNLIMLSILFLFGMSLLGVFVMNPPGQNTAAKASAKKGYAGSFFWGIFAFLMGFACMGPFMGPALEVAVRLSSPLLVLFFLLIGAGFALPFIIISLIPPALKLIPKPGEWMNIFKELMGFLLLLLVYKYLTNLWGLTKSGVYLLDVSHYLVFLGFAAWLYGRFVRMEYSKWVQFIFTLITLAVIASAAYSYLPLKEKHQPAPVLAVSGDLQPADHEGWYVFSPELFHRLQAEGKTVFLDIGAAWCTNCKVNERKVLHQEDIMQEFAELGVVLLKGDFTRKDPVLLDWIQKGGSIGVPFNVLYIPGQEPIKLPELFSKEDLRKALRQIPPQEEN